MPTGIVLELQKDCLNQQVPVSSILRKAKVIASKLGLSELKNWMELELNGYNCAVLDLPEHRKGIGQPKFHNPHHGWLPIQTEDDDFGKMVRTVYFRQAISELESLIEGTEKGGILLMNYSSAIERVIQNQLPLPMQVGLHFGKPQAAVPLNFVRNKTLDWTLELEEQGIIGEGLSFGQIEKQVAQAITNNIYGGNIGVLGTVSGDANNSRFFSAGRDLKVSEVSKFVSQVREAIPALPVQMRGDVEEIISSLEAETESQNPCASKISRWLTSLRSILEGATGNLAASGILAALPVIAASI